VGKRQKSDSLQKGKAKHNQRRKGIKGAPLRRGRGIRKNVSVTAGEKGVRREAGNIDKRRSDCAEKTERNK